ncbi:MAG TPA: hypothetical protein VEJ89_16140 [Myxococcaceae bacterium]|nr:hypothetical protein [Myxococcaceae bacterium]
MVRRICVLGAVFCLASCASTHVASQDYTTGSLVICGNKYATLEDLNTKAGQTCKSPQVLRCAEQKYGSQTSGSASAYGNAAYGTSTTKDLTGNCCQYQCPPTR